MSEALADPHLARELIRTREAALRRRLHNRLAYYQPYPKQAIFHEASKLYRERMLKAGNQQGKTWSAGFEVAMHLTGRYPDWWTGRRFTRPIAAWASGVTGESTRDNPQRILCGRIGSLGTGAIPKECFVGEPTSSRGVADAYDTVKVKHSSGGTSILQFKSYEKGREKWQGESLDLVWFDEEPPLDIYMEGLTRTNATGGMVMMTYTPLLGMSAVTCLFLKSPTPDRHVTNMTIRDALHYTDEQREKIIASYPAHERAARVEGTPMMGSGRIFPLADEAIQYEAMRFPAYFKRIAGIDFGWDHPTAVVWVAYDADSDVMYIYDAYRVREQTPVVHSAAIRARGTWIPVAWPHDGLQHDKGSGEQLAQQYRNQGIKMLHERASFPPKTKPDGSIEPGGNSVEAGVTEMLDRMQTGRLKVASHLADWFEEFRLYHREDGKIVKEMDDLMSATRYAMMMLRFAVTEQKHHMPESWRARLKASRRGAGSSAQAA